MQRITGNEIREEPMDNRCFPLHPQENHRHSGRKILGEWSMSTTPRTDNSRPVAYLVRFNEDISEAM
jgi:hypothetical protein